MNTGYGSQTNVEESTFLPRVVAPAKADNKRMHKRAVAVGASVALLTAGAVATYAALPGQTVTESAETNLKAQKYSEDDETVDTIDYYVPPFSRYDANGDGEVTDDEYVTQLQQQRDAALGRIAASDMSAEDKEDLSTRILDNFLTERHCVDRFTRKDRRENGEITEERFELFYHMIRTFCTVADVSIPEEFRPGEPTAVNAILAKTDAQTAPETGVTTSTIQESTEYAAPIATEPEQYGANPVVYPSTTIEEPAPVTPVEPSYVAPYVHEPVIAIEPEEYGTGALPLPHPSPIEEPLIAQPTVEEPIFGGEEESEPAYAVDELIAQDEEITDAIDAYVPLFSQYDTNHNGYISNVEYVTQLELQRDSALARVFAADLTIDQKADIKARIYSNFETEKKCVTKLASKDRDNNGEITEDRFDIFYNMIKAFCTLQDVQIPQIFRPAEPAVVDILTAKVDQIQKQEGITIDTPATDVFVPSTDAPVVVDPITGEKTFMTKIEFKDKISSHFSDVKASAEEQLAAAQLKAKQAALLKDLLQNCINQAADKFGWYGVYEQGQYFDAAVEWVGKECLPKNED